MILKDLRSQLIFWMTFVTVIPLIALILGLFNYNYIPLLDSLTDSNYNTLFGRLLIEQNSEAGRLADHISSFIQNIKMQGLLMGRAVLLPFLSTSNKNRLLNRFLLSDSCLDYIMIREIDDTVRSAGREGKKCASQMQSIISDPKLFQMTLAGEVSFSQPFLVDGTDELAMIISLPVLSETGRPLGALYLQVDLERIQELTEKANQLEPGTIYVVDSDGILVGHVDRKRVLAREDMKDLEIVKNYLASGKATGSIPYLDKEGNQVQGAFAPVDDLNWGVVAERLRSKAFLPADAMKDEARKTLHRIELSTFIGVLSTIVLSIAIGALLAVRITMPVREMAKGASEIARGNFSRQFELKGALEIRQLASTLNQMSSAIELHVKELRETFKGSVESLTAAIDAKDPYTQGHSRRVTLISIEIGKELHLSRNKLDELEISALMHDIGKIGIDDSILKKPSVVTEEELKVLQTHPELGAQIMRPIPMLKNMIPGMLHHHERWDGSGYPQGLKGKEIPLYGRIIAVADTFDAMTSDRPYQKTHDFISARDLIISWSGTKYDPEVVEAFRRVFDNICNMIVKLRE